MKTALIVCLLMLPFSYGAMAQPELNKRLQKQKAEFEAKIAAEEKYEELLQMAETAFENDQYADARNYYNEAIQYNASKEAWLTSKINDLDILMAERIALISNTLPRVIEVDSLSNIAIAEPNKEVEGRQQVAKTVIETVLPKDRTTIDSLVDSLESEEVIIDKEIVDAKSEVAKPLLKDSLVTQPERVVYSKPADSNTEVNKNEYADYPYGMTEEAFDLKNHTIQRIVVVDSLETNVYKRVKHSWGGDFTFKNDLSISQRIWLDELEKYRQKFGE